MDLGTEEISHEQKMTQIKYLVMSFLYSNAANVWFTPNENIECFLTGCNLWGVCLGRSTIYWQPS